MKRLMKRFHLPDYCDVREVVVRELDGKDEIEAAVMADANMTSALKSSAIAALGAEQREAIRLSIVEVDGVRVNTNGIPFKQMDNWSYRTMRFITTAFGEVNGVEQEDLKNFKSGATVFSPEESD